MKRSYLDYAMSVIVGRALPDVRDGLKPVHRRIADMMREMGLHSQPAHAEVARKIIGDVMGKLHPHGDCAYLRRAGAHGAAVFDAVSAGGRAGQLRFQWTATRPRAMRYTEARLVAHR